MINDAVHKNVFAVKGLAPQLCPSQICTSDFLCGMLLLSGFVKLFFLQLYCLLHAY